MKDISHIHAGSLNQQMQASPLRPCSLGRCCAIHVELCDLAAVQQVTSLRKSMQNVALFGPSDSLAPAGSADGPATVLCQTSPPRATLTQTSPGVTCQRWLRPGLAWGWPPHGPHRRPARACSVKGRQVGSSGRQSHARKALPLAHIAAPCRWMHRSGCALAPPQASCMLVLWPMDHVDVRFATRQRTC